MKNDECSQCGLGKVSGGERVWSYNKGKGLNLFTLWELTNVIMDDKCWTSTIKIRADAAPFYIGQAYPNVIDKGAVGRSNLLNNPPRTRKEVFP